MKLLLAAVVVMCAAFSGCKPETREPVEKNETGIPTEAQPKLQTVKLWLGAAEIEAELALTDQQRRTGMMFRKEMGENEGMLFVFPVAHQTGFWMKNTFVPLSAAYVDPAGVIVEIHDLQPQDTNNVPSVSNNIVYVLETPQGWFKRHNVETNTLVMTEHGTLSSVFSPGGHPR